MSRGWKDLSSWTGALFVVIVLSLVPVLWIISLSFKDPSTIADGNFFPSKWTTSNYDGIFKQSIFTDSLRNSIGIALIATVIAVIIASFAAYAIARLEFPGKAIILAASLGIAMFPPISIVGPLYNVWRQIGLPCRSRSSRYPPSSERSRGSSNRPRKSTGPPRSRRSTK